MKILYEACIENNSDISICLFQRINKFVEDVEIIKNFEIHKTEDFYLEKQLIAIIPWGKLYKKYLFENIRYPYGKLYEDEFTTYKLLFKLENIIYVPNELYYYYDNENSITNSIDKIKFIDKFEAIKDQLLFFYENKKDIRLVHYISNLFLQIYVKLLVNLSVKDKIVLLKQSKNDRKIKEVFQNVKFLHISKYSYFKNNSILNYLRNIKIFIYVTIKFYIIYYFIKM